MKSSSELEPTIEYAMDSSWSTRLATLGFEPDRTSGAEYLIYHIDGWCIEAVPCYHHTHVQLGVFSRKQQRFAQVPTRCAYKCAKLLIELLGNKPEVDLINRVDAIAFHAVHGP